MFSRLDFRRPPSPVFDPSRKGSVSQTAAGYRTYNRQQNELTHFSLKGLFDVDVFLTSKGENIAFPPPFSPSNVVPLFELPLENNKHLNFECRGQGRVWIVLFSEVTLFVYNVSTILWAIVGVSTSIQTRLRTLFCVIGNISNRMTIYAVFCLLFSLGLESSAWQTADVRFKLVTSQIRK